MMRFAINSLVCLVVGLSAAGSAQAANTWYAAPAPTGTGTTCSQPSPCPVAYALVTKPADGDTVVLAGGDYTVSSTIETAKRISIEGATSGAPTRLVGSTPGGPLYVLSYGESVSALPVHITDLQVLEPNGGGVAAYFSNPVAAPLIIDRVFAEATGANGGAMQISEETGGAGLVMRNSIARATGTNSTALVVGGPSAGSGTIDLRNVVANHRGSGDSKGMLVLGYSTPDPTCGNLTVVMKNSYVRSTAGPTTDIKIQASTADATQCTAVLQSSNSNWRDKQTNTGASATSTADQHSVDPLFTNAPGGDYHQLPGSPTIDAGVADAQLGPQDFGHEARVQGLAPDIGAYEFPAAPTLDKTAPVGSALAFSPSGFVPDSGKSSISRKKKNKKPGTTVSYKLSEAGTVSFTVQRKVKGRKQGKKCKTKRKKGKRCTIYKSVKGSFSRASTTSANSFHFTGVVGGKKLKRGSYRMIGTPTDTAGNKGAVFNGAFKVLRR